MTSDIATIILGSLCLLGAAAYVVARWKELDVLATILKASASTTFVALAVVNGATGTIYGRLILAGLVLSWCGDVFLLSLKKSYLLAGMGAFLLAHVVFIVAFASKPLSGTAAAVGAACILALAAITLRWLWKYLEKSYKIAVPLYLVTIGIMVVLAVAASGASLPTSVAVGAAAFAISDVSVARDRFVERSLSNKIWGIPLYYFAQVLLAASVNFAGQ